MNPINKRLREKIPKRFQSLVGVTSMKIWSECLYKIVMILSDQQLITGIAILITAMYLKIQGSITVYHFTIATDEAWFSSNTHLVSLTVLRGFLSEERKRTRQQGSADTSMKLHSRALNAFPAIWRAFFMLILASLLFYANVISGYQYW
jgi:hypothetical protein